MGASSDDTYERTVFRKVTLRLLPFLCVVYFFNILDRANIDFARLQMLEDVGITEDAYGLGAGIFFVGYCLLEVPSNLILSVVGARRWIARIMMSWGLLSAGMLFVVGPWSFYVLRFLLGCAEAGFFPGIVLYLTYWFPARQRARAVALFMMASPLTWVIGGPISGWLLDAMHARGGLAGWQWLFLLEGVPATLLGVATLFYLTDRPALAHWLSPAEQSWLTTRLASETSERQHGGSLRQAVSDPRVWHMVLLAATIAFGISGQTFYFVPLVEECFDKPSAWNLGLLKAVAGLCTLLTMIAVGMHSDRKGERRWHVAGAAFVAAAGWGLSMWHAAPIASFLGLVLANAAMMSMWGPFWSMATRLLGKKAAAGGIALINALANLGAFVGPQVMSKSKAAGGFTIGLGVMALMMVFGGVLALRVRREREARTDVPSPGEVTSE